MIGFIGRLFTEDSWKCAYRLFDGKNESVENRLKKNHEYKIINIPKRYWIADPFLFKKDDDMYVFFEIYDRYAGKAALGCTLLTDDSAPVYLVYEFDGHSSYPCIFEKNGEIYIIPETASEDRLVLLKCIHWPDKWIEVGNLLDGVNVVDSTVVHKNNSVSVFLYEKKNDTAILSFANVDIDRCCLTNITELKQYRKGMGRPGGNCLYKGEKLYRVVQPMYRYYGEKLEFYCIEHMSSEYREELVEEIFPQDVRTPENIKVDGIHTFNCLGDYEIIDLLQRKRISIFKPFMLLLKLLGIGCFDFGDRRHKKSFKEIIKRT